MLKYMNITVKQLHLLMNSSTGCPKVMHKNKEKNLISVHINMNGTYSVQLRMTRSYTYTMAADDIISVDTTLTRFSRHAFWNAFGCSRKFTHKSWIVGHYGSFINSESIFDSVRGRRDINGLGDWLLIFNGPLDNQKQLDVQSLKENFILDPESNMTCGFELETQQSGGLTRRTVNRHILMKRAKKRMDFEGPASLVSWMRENISGSSVWNENVSRSNRAWKQWLTENNVDSYDKAVELGWLTGTALDQIQRLIADNINDDEDDLDSAIESLAVEWELPENLELVDDESVSGFELRTEGGRSVSEFEESLNDAFKIDHHIDTRCSFHIHLSVPGLRHSFNRAQGQHIIRYLFENADRLPETVRTRWADNNANYFFIPDNEENKFNFIHFHRRLGTIEFRCFGNIQNPEEGMICLELATEALQDFYSSEHSIFVDTLNWGTSARSTMESASTTELNKFAKAHLAHMDIAREGQVIMEKILPDLELIQRANNFNFVVGE